jgi:hypothetical protein
MHYKEILESHGCGPEKLRKIFTTKIGPDATDGTILNPEQIPKTPKTMAEIHRRFRSRVMNRTIDGVRNNLRASRPFQAVDMAADAPPIQRHTIPLMMWAQGKLKIEQAYDSLAASGGTTQADKFFKKTDVSGKTVIKLNENRITDISIDLLKSYTTRRHAAMDALWSNQWPHFLYDPRGEDEVAQFRGDVLSARVDVMSDAYNYRHFFSQCRRQMLLYGYSVAFTRSAWDRKTGWRPVKTNTGEEATDEIESYVVREGVDFFNPHPSRIYYDISSPLANINTDTGPSYIGYWDLVQWRSLTETGSDFYNLENVFCTNGWTDLAATYSDYWNYYFDQCVLSYPDLRGPDPSIGNDIKANVGRYSSETMDTGVLLTHYYERINPLHEGIGTYDCNVWLHLTVAGDCTIIAAEFLPSIPACYGGINCNDGRLTNQSMAMALLGYQDQASNIESHMLMQLRTSLIQLWLIDKDSLDPEIIEEFKKNGTDSDWWVDRKLLIYSATKLRDLGIQDPRAAFAVVQAQIQNVFQAGLESLGQLLNLADRLLILSPNELGQPNPREVAAREVTEIAGSVQAINGFNNQGPREMTAAAKEMIYESLVTHGQPEIRVPGLRRYTREVVEAAGFRVAPDVKLKDNNVPTATPVMGNLRDLVYDYIFNSRDGAERPLNTQGAQVMTQLLQFLLQVPPIAQKMGAGQIIRMANSIIRMSGAPLDLQIELAPGEDDRIPAADEEIKKQVSAVQQQLQGLQQFLMQVLRPQGGGPMPNGAPPAPAGPVNGSPPLPPPGGRAMLQDPQPQS